MGVLIDDIAIIIFLFLVNNVASWDEFVARTTISMFIPQTFGLTDVGTIQHFAVHVETRCHYCSCTCNSEICLGGTLGVGIYLLLCSKLAPEEFVLFCVL
jgi:hypothetical protein